MAFDVNFLGRVSSSANTQALAVWTYNATASGGNEAQAVIAAAGFFNAAQQNLTAGLEAGLLAVGDVVLLNGNDTRAMVAVTAVTTNVAVAAY